MDKLNILGCPAYAWDYEFIVVRKNASGDGYYYLASFMDGFEADKFASLVSGGVVIHNVRTQGKKKKNKKGT